MAAYDDLKAAGLIADPNNLTPTQIANINTLSSAEAAALISAHTKLDFGMLSQNVNTASAVPTPAKPLGIVF